MSSSVPTTNASNPEEPQVTPEKIHPNSEGAAVSQTADQSPETSEQIQIVKLNKKKAQLALQIEELRSKIETAQAELEEANAKLGDIDASARVQRHIKLLHQYNEIKDIGMGLFGMIAEHRGVQVKDVFEEFGVSEAD